MLDIRNIVDSIFDDLIKKLDFQIVESDEHSILYSNKYCFLFVGHHMGEVYVHIKREKQGSIILPFMWAVITNKFDYKQSLSVKVFDSNINSLEILKYNLVVEKTLISLFCTDLLSGDFSNLENYQKNIEMQNKAVYEYYSKI